MAEDYAATKEKMWVSSLGERIGNAATAIVEADSLAKDKQLERTRFLLGLDNIDFRSNTNIIGVDQALETGISVPPISVLDQSQMVVDDAHIKLDLEVHESAADTTNVKVGSETEASVSGGVPFIGPKVSVKQTVRASVSNDRSRKSDYSSKMEVYCHMTQAPPAEGMQVVLDALVSPIKKAAEVNAAIIERQGEAMIEQAQTVDSLPEAESAAE